MKASEIPNLISIMRIVLIAPVIWCLLTQQYALALLLFAVAGISDGLDGFLAKRYDWRSELGGMLDPIADKLLLVSCFVVLAILELIPLELTIAVILRDVLIVVGAVIYHFKIEVFDAHPLLISKLNTLVQILLVITVVAAQDVIALPEWLVPLLVILVWGTTVLSGIAYIWIWGRKARDIRSR